MGPSEKSFDQVKAILGKLDRSIDQLRAKRLTPPAPERAVVPATPAAAALVPPANSSHAPQPQRSAFGRATPLPPRGN
jgi:hypothetical protein